MKMSAQQKRSRKAKTRHTSQEKNIVKKPGQAIKPDHEPKEAKGKLALILVRGLVGIRADIKVTLFSLRLRKKHACVVIEDTLNNRSAALKCKDYITYGEMNDETLKQLLEKRGKKDSKKKGHLKKFFLLHPPRGGFERKGIKSSYTRGGALGYRGTRINDLIKRML